MNKLSGAPLSVLGCSILDNDNDIDYNIRTNIEQARIWYDNNVNKVEVNSSRYGVLVSSENPVLILNEKVCNVKKCTMDIHNRALHSEKTEYNTFPSNHICNDKCDVITYNKHIVDITNYPEYYHMMTNNYASIKYYIYKDTTSNSNSIQSNNIQFKTLNSYTTEADTFAYNVLDIKPKSRLRSRVLYDDESTPPLEECCKDQFNVSQDDIKFLKNIQYSSLIKYDDVNNRFKDIKVAADNDIIILNLVLDIPMVKNIGHKPFFAPTDYLDFDYKIFKKDRNLEITPQFREEQRKKLFDRSIPVSKLEDFEPSTVFDVEVPENLEMFSLIINNINPDIISDINNKSSYNNYSDYQAMLKNSTLSRSAQIVVNNIKKRMMIQIDSIKHKKIYDIHAVGDVRDTLNSAEYAYNTVENTIKNKVVCSIDENVIKNIKQLKYLRLLNLIFMEETGISALPDSIEVLEICNTSVAKLPAISLSSKLKILDISNNNLLALEPDITNAVGLQIIKCSVNRINDCSIITHLENLLSIDCSYNLIEGSFNICKYNPDFKLINISFNNIKYIGYDTLKTLNNINNTNKTIHTTMSGRLPQASVPAGMFSTNSSDQSIPTLFKCLKETLFVDINNIHSSEDCDEFFTTMFV